MPPDRFAALRMFFATLIIITFSLVALNERLRNEHRGPAIERPSLSIVPAAFDARWPS